MTPIGLALIAAYASCPNCARPFNPVTYTIGKLSIVNVNDQGNT